MTTVLVIGLILAAVLIGYWIGRRSAAPGVTALAEARARAAAEAERPKRPDRSVHTDIERALADLRLGVIVVGQDGAESYRNRKAAQYATGRHGDALVEAALGRVVEGALLGLSLEESVEVYGPPARSLLVQASPTYDGGELNGAVGVIEDITEARHIDRVRSDFVANVSHELRTPVGAMSVLAETIADATDPDVIARLTARMQREANRLSDTIEDLLVLSRLESGPLLELETIDLVSIVTMAVERNAETAAHRGVVVTVQNESDGPIMVEGEQGQLVSAVANLLENAIKYSDPSSTVSVALRATPSAQSNEDAPLTPGGDGDLPEDRVGTAEIAITDTGIGIPERDLDRIFERFYRVDSARSRETGGTGLGLSIVRNAIRNHQGAIGVESVEGQGSTFMLRLPISETQTQLSEESAPQWTN